MRSSCILAAVLLTACATRTQPYRFSSSMLGMADVPPAPLPGVRPDVTQQAHRAAPPARRAGGWQADAQEGRIRVVSAAGIEIRKPTASAEEAAAITDELAAQPAAWAALPAPHRAPAPSVTAVAAIPASPHEPSELRSLVGVRDKRDPFAIVTTWTTQLGLHVEGTDGPSIVDWASRSSRLADPSAVALPGDLLVFDRAVTKSDESDLVALVLARDARGVTEFLYAGGGVIRRGFLDPSRPTIRRDADGVVVNTFLRHGSLWPPKGTRYLSGELLAHVVHVH